MHISQNLGRRGDNDVMDESTERQVERRKEMSQRKSFLIELDTMVRLRSPYTVNVYGAVTAKRDRLILVMELLSGGDLRTFLSNRERPLPEPQSRQIIADICAGMAFLHRKEAVHGDLKSANVLLDGAGRAKVRVAHCTGVILCFAVFLMWGNMLRQRVNKLIYSFATRRRDMYISEEPFFVIECPSGPGHCTECFQDGD